MHEKRRFEGKNWFQHALMAGCLAVGSLGTAHVVAECPLPVVPTSC